MNRDNYAKIIKQSMPPSPILKNSISAFLVGGTICLIGQCLYNLYQYLGINEEISSMLVPISLILISCILTGFGIYDRIAKFAGAGTLVPITGFANAVCSPAIDNKAEGYVLGMAAKMFVIAGSVIVYGTLFSFIFGIVFYLLKIFGIDITGFVLG